MTSSNVQVLVRARPFVDRERESNARCILHMQGQRTTLLDPDTLNAKEHFNFDHCLWSVDHSSGPPMLQADVYRTVGPQMLDNILTGYNACLFAYGQTGSGKTYTMMGDLESPGDKGIIPRLCEDLFERMRQQQQADQSISFKLEASYMEIYTEQVRDLLSVGGKDTDRTLRVRQHPVTGPFVDGLSSFVVPDFASVYKLLQTGDRARATASTRMNQRSSRSHAILTMSLSQLRIVGPTDTRTRNSKIHLVDLAGSERVAVSGVEGIHFKEATSINLSLTTLGRVIDVLLENAQTKRKPNQRRLLPPYRDSLLTWILSESIGGNSRTLMIAAVSPSRLNYEETLSTLRYSSCARQVVNVAVVNEDSTAAMVASLKAQLEKVTHQSEQMREREAQHLAKIDALQALPKGSGGGAKTTQGKSGQEDTIDKVLRDKLVDMKARFEEERRQWRKERDTLERRLQGSSGSYELKAEFEVVRAARDSLQRALAEAELREQALKKQLAARDQELQQLRGAASDSGKMHRASSFPNSPGARSPTGYDSSPRVAILEQQLAESKASVRKLQVQADERDGLERRLRALKDENEQLSADLRASKRAQRDAEESRARYGSSNQQVLQMQQDHRKALEALEQKLADTNKSLWSLQEQAAERDSLQRQVRALKDENSSVTAQLQTLKKSQRQREDSTAQSGAQLRRITDERDVLLTKVDQLRENDRLHVAQIAELKALQAGNYDAKLRTAKFEEERSVWTREREKLLLQVKRLEAEKNDLISNSKKILGNMDRNTWDKERLQDEVKTLRAENERLESERHSLSLNLATMKRNSGAFDAQKYDLESQLRQAKTQSASKIESLERQNDALTAELSELSRLSAEKQRWESQRTQYEDQVDRIKAETDRQCFEREKVVMQNSKLAAQLETARGQLESLRIEKEAVQKQLTTAQDKHAQSEGQVAMLQEQVEVLQGQVSRREELKKGQLEDAAHELQRAKEEWVLERERLAQSVTAHVGDKVQLEETIAKLHADLRLTQLEQGKATKSAQRLERDIGEMEQDRQRWAKEKEGLKKELSELRQHRYELEAEAQQAREALQRCQRETERDLQTLKEEQAQAAQDLEALQTLRKERQNWTVESQAWAAEKEELKAQLQEQVQLCAKHERAARDFETFTLKQDQDLEAATARVQALEAQLREAEVETDGKRGEWDEERNRMMVSSSEQRRENRRLAEQLASAEAERESQHKAAGEQLEEQAQRIVGLMMENREHAARAKSLEQENAALRTCVERLEPDLQGSQTEAAELKDRNRDLEVRIAALKSNAESTDAATQRLEQLCQQLEMDAARHRDELEELTRTNVRLRVDEGEALQKVAELEGKIRDSEREAEERCEAVRGDANAVEEELESLRARHSAALKEAEGMQEEHQKVLCQVQDLEQQEQLLQADVNRAKAAASAYEAKIAELRQDKLQLEKTLDDTERLQQNTDRAVKDRAAKQQAEWLSEKEDMLSKLQQETRKSLRLETQLQQLQAESVAQQSELAELQAAQAVAKQETQAMQALRGERVLLLQKEAQLKADAEEGTRRQRRLEHEKEEMAAELEALRGAQAQQLADLDRQRHQLAELRAKVGDHTLEKSQVEDKYGEMQAKHQKAVADLQSLQKQTQALEEELEELRRARSTERTAAAQRMQKAEGEKQVLESQLDVAQDELKLLESQLQQSKARLEAAAAETQEAVRLKELELTAKFEEQGVRIEKASMTEFVKLEQDLAAAQERGQQAASATRALEERVEAQRVQCTQQQQELQDVQQQLADCRKRERQLQAQVQELEERVAQYSEGEEHWRRQKVQYDQQSEMLREEVRKQTQEEQKTDLVRVQREKELAELKSKMMMKGLLDKAMENSETILGMGNLEEFLQVVVEEVDKNSKRHGEESDVLSDEEMDEMDVVYQTRSRSPSLGSASDNGSDDAYPGDDAYADRPLQSAWDTRRRSSGSPSQEWPSGDDPGDWGWAGPSRRHGAPPQSPLGYDDADSDASSEEGRIWGR